MSTPTKLFTVPAGARVEIVSPHHYRGHHEDGFVEDVYVTMTTPPKTPFPLRLDVGKIA